MLRIRAESGQVLRIRGVVESGQRRNLLHWVVLLGGIALRRVVEQLLDRDLLDDQVGLALGRIKLLLEAVGSILVKYNVTFELVRRHVPLHLVFVAAVEDARWPIVDKCLLQPDELRERLGVLLHVQFHGHVAVLDDDGALLLLLVVALIIDLLLLVILHHLLEARHLLRIGCLRHLNIALLKDALHAAPLKVLPLRVVDLRRPCCHVLILLRKCTESLGVHDAVAFSINRINYKELNILDLYNGSILIRKCNRIYKASNQANQALNPK